MKKTLRTILAGAVALLAVSCYDDSELRGKVDKLDERVTVLETKLNAEVGGLNDLATRLAAAEAGITTLNGNVTTFTSQITGILTRLDAVEGGVNDKLADLLSIKNTEALFEEGIDINIHQVAEMTLRMTFAIKKAAAPF